MQAFATEIVSGQMASVPHQDPQYPQGHLEVETVTQCYILGNTIINCHKMNVGSGSRNCDYTCTDGGGCKVTYVGPPRGGKTQVNIKSNIECNCIYSSNFKTFP